MKGISVSDCLSQNGLTLLEKQILLSFVLGTTRTALYLQPQKILTQAEYETFQQLHKRALQGEPIAYLISAKEFWSLPFKVTPATLIPRPETELLVETALTLLPEMTIKVADLGTGSGAIALALASERPKWNIFATDQSEEALSVAKWNAENLGFSKNVTFSQGDWCEALPKQKFDLIVSNPPYISETEWPNYANGLRFEPFTALVSGEHGMDAIETIIHSAIFYLQPGGFLMIEHGFLQARLVRDILNKAMYQTVYSLKDMSGHERLTIGQWFKS